MLFFTSGSYSITLSVCHLNFFVLLVVTMFFSVSDLNVMGWTTAPAFMSVVGVVARARLTLEEWEEMVGM